MAFKFKSLNDILILIFFVYLTANTFTALMIIIITLLYYNPNNNIKNNKKKTLLKFLLIITIFLYYVISSPVFIFILVINKISKLLGVQIFTKNIHIVLLDLLIYILAYFSCIGIYRIPDLDIIKYLCFISFICIIAHFLIKIIYRINNFFSFKEKYEYLYKSRLALIYIINILTIFTGVSGLYISKYNDGEFSAVIIFYIMPLIIFSGIEQIVLCIKQNKSEGTKFIQNLYEELVILHDIAIPQITDFSCIKIKIKISIKSYVIDDYKNHFFSKNKKKDKIIIETLEKCKNMIEKEYDTYVEEEKLNFENDLTKNIDNLAKCLTILL